MSAEKLTSVRSLWVDLAEGSSETTSVVQVRPEDSLKESNWIDALSLSLQIKIKWQKSANVSTHKG